MYMNRIIPIRAWLCALLLCLALPIAARTAAEKAGWKLSLQSYTFHKFTLLEAFDKAEQLGIKYMEVFPGHRIGGKWGDQVFGYELDAASQKELRKLARQKGIRIVGTGVFTSDNPEDWDRLFRFARDMKMEYISCEPPAQMWDHIEQLAQQYKIRVAVHNHPQPSTYWKPDLLLQHIAERSTLIGSCADVGHWKRESLDHLGCLRQLEGRIHSLHFKDIVAKQSGKAEQHDTIWGRGILDVKEMLAILRQQKFRGYFTIEYEYNWENSVPDIRRCVEYFNEVCEGL